MTTASGVPWPTLERLSAPAFLGAGVLWLGDASLNSLELLEIYTHGWLNGVLVSGAMLVTVIGLLGFIPKFSEEWPLLATGHTVIGGLAGITMGVTVVWMFGAILLARVSTPPGITAVPAFVAFGWFGVAALWTDIPSRLVGLLLMVLLAPWVVMLVAPLLGAPAWLASPPPWSIAVVAGLWAVLSITIGYLVRTTALPTDLSDRTVDSSV